MMHLKEASQQIRIITNWLVNYVNLSFFIVLIVMAAVNIIYCYLVYGQINEDLLYFPYHFM